MTCQVCGTVDDSNGIGPVKVVKDEGLCKRCNMWFFLITGGYL